MNHAPSTPEVPLARWADLIPEDQWAVFTAGRDAAARAGVPFLLGGAMALAPYTGRWRNTKDIDLVVRNGTQEPLIRELLASGFDDYHHQKPYDRSWIFRACRGEVILDIIWSLPNHRVLMDEEWFTHARLIKLRGETHRSIPLEEFVRVKLYVMQRERCDWVDVINALAGSVERINWPHLIARMGRDLPLLQAVLIVFAWMSPARVAAIPPEVRQRFSLPENFTDDAAATEARRVQLLDSRPWYAPFQPEDKPLER
jgi:hypothetical protein